jgi:hypothetical protein
MERNQATGDPSNRNTSWRFRLTPYAAFAGIVGLYYLSALAFGLRPDLGRGLSAVVGIRIVPILIVAYLFGLGAWTGLVRERTIRGTKEAMGAELRSPDLAERLIGIPFLIMGTVYTFDVYASFKQGIPSLTAYDSDPWLAAVDAFVHLGRDPWRWTHAVLGGPGLRFLDWVYTSWYVVLITSIPVVATWAPLQVRSRFFLTFSAVMMLGGSFAAILFASGGPAYFAELVGDSVRFSPLLESLEGTTALAPQGRLWEYFSTNAENLYGGISAMPSMHVAVVVLISVAAWAWSRLLGCLAAGYAFLIFLGSFHLGWHYAIDGYLAAALVMGIWLLSGPLTRGHAGVNEPGESPSAP